MDLIDSFYQLKCTQLASLCGLGVTMAVRDVEALLGRKVPGLYFDREGRIMPTAPCDLAEAAFEGMAMCWSWAFHFCKESIAASA